MSDDGDNVIPFGMANSSGEFTDHQVFLDLVKEEIAGRPVINTLVLVFDDDGRLTVHSSTTDTERVLALASKLQQHALNMWDAAIRNHVMDDDGGDHSPAA